MEFTFGRDSSLLSLSLTQFEFISVFQEVAIHFCTKSTVKGERTHRSLFLSSEYVNEVFSMWKVTIGKMCMYLSISIF